MFQSLFVLHCNKQAPFLVKGKVNESMCDILSNDDDSLLNQVSNKSSNHRQIDISEIITFTNIWVIRDSHALVVC